MISIIIPVYNQAAKLSKTLQSIAAQTYLDYEVIVVNDGSSDNPEMAFIDYVKKIESSQRYLFLNQANGGAPVARNRGLKEAQGDYLFFCDADVVLEPKALETMWSTLEGNWSASYVYSDFRWGSKLFRPGPFDAEKLKRQPCINTMSLIRRRDFWESAWDESLKKFQDWDLWLSFLERGKVGLYIPEVLFTVSPGGHISSWLPSFSYRLFPFLKEVKKYKAAMKVIKEKHGL